MANIKNYKCSLLELQVPKSVAVSRRQQSQKGRLIIFVAVFSLSATKVFFAKGDFNTRPPDLDFQLTRPVPANKHFKTSK